MQKPRDLRAYEKGKKIEWQKNGCSACDRGFVIVLPLLFCLLFFEFVQTATKKVNRRRLKPELQQSVARLGLPCSGAAAG